MFSNDDITQMATDIENSLLEKGDPFSGDDYAMMQVARAWLNEHPAKKTSKFKIKLLYFKPSGKFYSEGEYGHEQDNTNGLTPNTCYMAAVITAIRESQIHRTPLPGLIGTWDGPILVDCEQGYPCLILPK